MTFCFALVFKSDHHAIPSNALGYQGTRPFFERILRISSAFFFYGENVSYL